jgi:hypothetical protein
LTILSEELSRIYLLPTKPHVGRLRRDPQILQ